MFETCYLLTCFAIPFNDWISIENEGNKHLSFVLLTFFPSFHLKVFCDAVLTLDERTRPRPDSSEAVLLLGALLWHADVTADEGFNALCHNMLWVWILYSFVQPASYCLRHSFCFENIEPTHAVPFGNSFRSDWYVTQLILNLDNFRGALQGDGRLSSFRSSDGMCFFATEEEVCMYVCMYVKLSIQHITVYVRGLKLPFPCVCDQYDRKCKCDTLFAVCGQILPCCRDVSAYHIP